ncbi:MAG TPA: energy transducer TonB [Chitinophaga sp.]|uniref:energy transducer TonB n=1 Tax=Chitinophaga sp. TaxID=1869181 RepID=UPI002D049398|nr:energy transducer TonB [Chitinophaga sp.]HVI47093.1 energy transducer TonB [Chitinophaga sp.]
MPDKDAHKKTPVSAELIRQYLAGELDDKAMHALERRALDDPFLAEALEGYALHAPDQRDIQEELTVLLADRVAPRKAKVRTLYPRLVAAAAILLLMSVGGWFLLREQRSAPPIAGIAPAPPSSTSNADSVVQPALREANTKSDKPQIAQSLPEKKVVVPADVKPAPAPLPATLSAPVNDQPLDKKMLRKSVPPPQAEESASVAVSADAVNADNEKGIAGFAPVQRNEVLAKDAAAPKVQSYTAVHQQKVRVAVAERRPDSSLLAAPVGGFRAFYTYLNTHTVNPDNRFNGDVRIAFTVMPDSSLQEFKVINGLNAACDAEAIRVIKEGPAWKPALDGKPARVEVDVLFKVKED